MKYIYLILVGLLALAPSTYAEGDGDSNQMSMAQQSNITVKGKVVDSNGELVVGATVVQKGTTNGTITDIDGNFSLSVSSDATLIVSFIGFKSVEVNVAGKTDMGTITLASDTKEIDQVVVVGYGTQRKVDLTGSVAIVDADEMKKASNSNISTMLQGKVSGVQITSDGQPGADPAVRIRGIGSFNDTNPLYVIDGVPMGTTIRDFSPNDIESIQVLKDASAAAVYGARAANGVVIITTKQGKKNSPMKIDYTGYFGVDGVPSGVYDVMDSYQYADYVTASYNNADYDAPNGYDPTNEGYLDPSVINTNWFDEMFKIGTRQNHNVNLSGGGENSTYNVGLDYYSQEGTMEGAGPSFDRFTVRVNNTMDVKFIKLKTNVVYSHSYQTGLGLGNGDTYVEGLNGNLYPVMASTLIMPPSIKARDESTWCLDDKLNAASEYSYDSYGYGTYYSDLHGELRITNPLLLNNIIERQTTVDRVVASGSANVDLIGMLGKTSANHKLNYNLNVSYSKTNCFYLIWLPAFIQSSTNYMAKDDETLTEHYYKSNDALIENTITYDANLGRNHFNFLVGQTFERIYDHNLYSYAHNLYEPYYLQISNADSEDVTSTSDDSEYAMASYLGRLNYNYADKYLFSAVVRRDGSSRLSSDDRFGIFPSVSAGWRLEKESFFPVDESIIHLCKIRGSYGELGNDNIGNYAYMSTLDKKYTYSWAGTKATGSSISSYVNSEIRWEKKKTLDFGLDLGMFNNMLDFTFDWYKATSEDLLYDVTPPYSSGSTDDAITMNAATMVNTGMEFLVAYHNHQHPVKFDVAFNLSTIQNEVKKLGLEDEPTVESNCRTQVGHEVGEFYGYVIDDQFKNGIYQSQDDIDNQTNDNGDYIAPDNAEPGDVAYKDINNDGTIDTDDREILGSGLPDFTYGVNVNLGWKGFDLSIATNGVGGFQAWDYVDGVLKSSYGALNKSTDLLNAWTSENTDTDVPRVAYSTSNTMTNDMFSKRYIQNANYLKISNIELGYNLPDNWFAGFISGARVYVSGQNLYTFSKYKGYNVDFAGGTMTPGYNYCSYPSPRTVKVGAHFSF